MKKTSFKTQIKVLAICLVVSIVTNQKVSAQGMCSPAPATLTDNLQLLLPKTIDPQYGMGSSVIDYSPFCVSCPTTQLYAVAYTDYLAGVGSVYIKDDGTGSTLSYSFSSDYASPDVLVGNNTATPGNYYVAVVYTIGGNVKLDLYDIGGAGSGLYLNSFSSNTIAGGANNLNARIDGVMDYQNQYPLPGNPPLVEKFAMVWETTGAGINAYAASLSIPGGGIYRNITASPDAHIPDVAAVVQKSISTPPFEEHAFISYIVTSNNLLFADWNITINSLAGPGFVATSSPNTYRKARIAANRDVNNNYPPMGNVNWMIAVDDNTNAVYEYDNVGNSVLSCNTLPTPKYGLYPEIAAGPGNTYNVGFMNNFNSNYENVQLSTLFPTPFGYPNYYYIPFIFHNPTNLALCATNNTNNIPGYTDYLYGFWQQDYAVLYEKSSTNPLVFRSTGVPNVTVGSKERAYPNPAIGNIILETEGIAGDNATYKVTDMAGRQLTAGNIRNNKQSIDVSNLASGMYLLSVFTNGAIHNTLKFTVQ